MPSWHAIAVPDSRPKVAINTGLPAGDFDGQVGEIRVGTYPDQECVRFIWNATAGKWTSDSRYLVSQMDQGYLTFTATATWEYLTSTTGGSGTPTQTGFTSRSWPHAGELYSAGCRVQCHITGIIAGNNSDTGSVRAYFFQHNDDETVNTIVSGAPNGALGNSPSITSPVGAVVPATTAGHFRGSGWVDLSLSSITKKHLWAQLFAQKNGTGSASPCQALDVEVQVRWVL